MVECEYVESGRRRRLFKVLIDTWWNVNDEYVVAHTKIIRVLIDTWWNVNTYGDLI